MSDVCELVAAVVVARELGVCRKTLYRWIKDEDVRFPAPTRIKERLFFDRAAVEAWKAARLREAIAALAA